MPKRPLHQNNTKCHLPITISASSRYCPHRNRLAALIRKQETLISQTWRSKIVNTSLYYIAGADVAMAACKSGQGTEAADLEPEQERALGQQHGQLHWAQTYRGGLRGSALSGEAPASPKELLRLSYASYLRLQAYA